jgi:hypothetical protein
VDLGSITINANTYDAIDSTISNENKMIIPYIDSYTQSQTPAVSLNVIRTSNKWYIGYHNPTNASVTIKLKCKVI